MVPITDMAINDLKYTVIDPIRAFEILQFWDLLGNPWNTPIIINLEVFFKNKVVSEMEEIDLYELRYLAGVGFMTRRNLSKDFFINVTYQISRAGLKWLNRQRVLLKNDDAILEDLPDFDIRIISPEGKNGTLIFEVDDKELYGLSKGAITLKAKVGSYFSEKALNEEGEYMASRFRNDQTQVLFRGAPGRYLFSGKKGEQLSVPGMVYTYIGEDWEFHATFMGEGDISPVPVELEEVEVNEEYEDHISEEEHLIVIDEQRDHIRAEKKRAAEAEKTESKKVRRGAK